MTNGEARMIGTVKFTNIDWINQWYVTCGIEALKDKPRGSWVLVQAFDNTKEVEKQKQDHKAAMNKLPVHERTSFLPPVYQVAD